MSISAGVAAASSASPAAAAARSATPDVAAAASANATLSYPLNAQSDVDATHLFTWTAVASAQNYLLVVGTSHFGTDIVTSAVLPAAQTSFRVAALPSGKTLYATLLTKTGGAWGYSEATFTSAPGATLTSPVQGETTADSTRPFTWSTIAASQGAILVVGTTHFGADVANSGVLPAGQTSYLVAGVPTGKTLYATLLTKVAGAWARYDAITFTALPDMDRFSHPLDGQIGVDPAQPFTWSTVAASQGAILVVGTAHFGTDLVNSGVLPAGQGSYRVPVLPLGKTLYATLLTKTNGTFTRFQAITFTAAPSTAPGSLDHSFGTTGQVTLAPTGSTPRSLAYVPGTGQTIAGYVMSAPSGGLNSFVSRLSSSGTIDTTFGVNGSASLPAGMDVSQVVDAGAGKVLAVGLPTSASGPNPGTELVRLTAAGALDATFGTGGAVIIAAGAPYAASPGVVVGSAGRIFVALTFASGASTTEVGIAAFGANGTADTTFGTAGMAATAFGGSAGGSALALQGDGNLVVAGSVVLPGASKSQAMVARFGPGGQPDTTFADHGVFVSLFAGTSDYLRRLVVEANGNLLVAGSQFAGTAQLGLIAELTPAGTVNPAFGSGGTIVEHPAGDIDHFLGLGVGPNHEIYGLMMQQDGPFNASLRRYNPNGQPDLTFGTAGVVTLTNLIPTDLAIGFQGHPEVALEVPPASASVVAQRFLS